MGYFTHVIHVTSSRLKTFKADKVNVIPSTTRELPPLQRQMNYDSEACVPFDLRLNPAAQSGIRLAYES